MLKPISIKQVIPTSDGVEVQLNVVETSKKSLKALENSIESFSPNNLYVSAMVWNDSYQEFELFYSRNEIDFIELDWAEDSSLFEQFARTNINDYNHIVVQGSIVCN